MKRLLTLIAVGVLWASASWAADGDECSTTQWANIDRGSMRPIMCVLLCDAIDAAAECAEYDLNDLLGVPDVVVFEMYENLTDCTAAVVTINTSFESGISTTDANAFDIGSTTQLSLVGTRRLVLDARQAPLDRYVYTKLDSESDCSTGSVDIMMIGYEHQRAR